MKLHGFAISNYYNMVKMVLLEKGMDFEEVLVRPSQSPDYLASSPMGKVPCLETEQGFLTETCVIIDYLHELGIGPSFYPQDPFARAKVRELIHYLELYIELPARRLYGDAFFGKPATDEEKAAGRKALGKGFNALLRLAHFKPYLAGTELTYADMYFYFSVGTATRAAKISMGWDAFNEVPGVRALMTHLGQRESIRRILADQQASG
ncbi:MAG: glutathione S-transferase family protein [Gammaproteobacteria bacterium]|nr:glutathione S-transferase family protein [Gammaproteobacteria bacterium]MDP2347565.1 glutathione S-transferase family protein [Gammaproteobacteria bacterium]